MRRLAASLLVAMTLACWPPRAPYGFKGGGLPPDLKTIAVTPFTNETAAPELQREILDAVRESMRRDLGLRDAAESKAHATLTGTIRRYEADIAESIVADQRRTTAGQRKLRITVDMEFIDTRSLKTLFLAKGLTVEGLYPEGAEETGRKEAIHRLVQALLDGVEKNW